MGTRHLSLSFPLYEQQLEQTVANKSSFNSHSKSSGGNSFHSLLLHHILKAKRRVLISTLYLGLTDVESENSDTIVKNRLTNEFMDAIVDFADRTKVNNNNNNNNTPSLKILMDSSRGMRAASGDTTTGSAELIHNRISGSQATSHSCVFLSSPHLHHRPKRKSSAITESFHGTHHGPKFIVIDDTLILTGANLSEEYFREGGREDRVFCVNAIPNSPANCCIVNFYAQLIERVFTAPHHAQMFRDDNNDNNDNNPPPASWPTTSIRSWTSTSRSRHNLQNHLFYNPSSLDIFCHRLVSQREIVAPPKSTLISDGATKIF